MASAVFIIGYFILIVQLFWCSYLFYAMRRYGKINPFPTVLVYLYALPTVPLIILFTLFYVFYVEYLYFSFYHAYTGYVYMYIFID
jgi:hypothetical protein